MKLISNLVAVVLLAFCVAFTGGCGGGSGSGSSNVGGNTATAQKLPFTWQIIPDQPGPSGLVERPAAYQFVLTVTLTATEDFTLMGAVVNTSEKLRAVELHVQGIGGTGGDFALGNTHHLTVFSPYYSTMLYLKKGQGTILYIGADMDGLDGKVLTTDLTKIDWINASGAQFSASLSGVSSDVLVEALPDTRAYALVPLSNNYSWRGGVTTIAPFQFENLSNDDDADVTFIHFTMNTTRTADLPNDIYLQEGGRIIGFARVSGTDNNKTRFYFSLRSGDLRVAHQGQLNVAIVAPNFNGTTQTSYTINVTGFDVFNVSNGQGMGTNGIVNINNGHYVDFITNFP